MTTRMNQNEAPGGLPADPDAITALLRDARYASGQVRDLLWLLYEHKKLAGEDGLHAAILACLEYLEDQEGAINTMMPLIGVCSDGEPLAVRPA